MPQRIPEPTSDIRVAASQLRELGVTIVRDVMTSAQLAQAQTALENLALEERRSGLAFLESGRSSGLEEPEDDGPNQRLQGLIGKGDIFGELAQLVGPLALVRDSFGDSYGLPLATVTEFDLDDVLISSVSANIAMRGGSAQNPHADQGFAPACTGYPLVMNVIFMITPFTESNGATLVAPGSHLVPTNRHYVDPPPLLPACGPAGSALILDGRVWHGTGENGTDEPRTGMLITYCRPFVRQFENFALSLSKETAQNMSQELLSLLGFRVWMLLGGINGERHNSMIR